MEAYKVFLFFPDGLCQMLHVGNTDFFMAPQQHMDITIGNMSLPQGLFLGHGVIVKAVDKGVVSVNVVSAHGKLLRVAVEDGLDGGIQGLALAQIPGQVFLFRVNHQKSTFL